MANETPIIQIKERKWIEHRLSKGPQAIERQALNWNCQGLRKRGRPKRAWKRMIEEEIGKWERRGNKLEPWPTTGSVGDASWKLYAPEETKRYKPSKSISLARR
jgi:hypothetical protein